MALTLDQRVDTLFASLSRKGASPALMRRGFLADKLDAHLRKHKGKSFACNADLAELYATAAIEMWQRSIHSFLMSAAMTVSSTLWSSVAGYYASHYSIRAFAHAIGYFHSHRRRSLVRLDLSGAYTCHIENTSREHIVYWKVVKKDANFASDTLFTENEDPRFSDSAHRSVGNYLDHVGTFPPFKVLNEQALKSRIKQLSEMELSTYPAIDSEKYPDTDSVQLIAYHRIVRFRKLLDRILGSKIKFWTSNRQPEWCTPFLDFQITEPKLLLAPGP